MKSIWKIIVLVTIIVALVFIIKGVRQDSDNLTVGQGEAEEVVLGAILPLTGDFAEVGEFIKQGMELAQEVYSQQGQDVALYIQDDGSAAKGSVNAANTLVARGDIDIALTATVQEVKPMAPIFNTNQIPLIAVWDNNDVIAESGEYVFSTGYVTEAAGQDMAQLARDKGVEKAAVITQQDEWSHIIAGAFVEEFESKGGEVVLRDDVNFDVRDFRTFLAEAKAKDVDGIYFPFIPSYLSPFVAQATELGLDVVLMTGDSMSQGEIDDTGVAMNDVYFTSVDTNELTGLVDLYVETYGEEPADPAFVSFGYHGVQMAVEALANDSLDPKRSLERTSIKGFDGVIDFDKDNQAKRTQKIFQVQDLSIVEYTG